MKSAQDRYVEAMVSLTPDRLDAFVDLFAPNARFKDPFHDVRGKAQIRAIFAHMYEVLNDVRFKPCSQASNDNKLFLSWTFEARQRWLGDINIPGASEITFTPDGLVSEHIDYWDKSDLYKNLNFAGRTIAQTALLFRRR
jgi:steroid delta-isomerase